MKRLGCSIPNYISAKNCSKQNCAVSDRRKYSRCRYAECEWIDRWVLKVVPTCYRMKVSEQKVKSG